MLAAPSRATFDALANMHEGLVRSRNHTHEHGPRVVITWATYLEHELREAERNPTALAAGLADSIRASFVALGGRKGYLDADDLGISDGAAGGGAHGGASTHAGGTCHGTCAGGERSANCDSTLLSLMTAAPLQSSRPSWALPAEVTPPSPCGAL